MNRPAFALALLLFALPAMAVAADDVDPSLDVRPRVADARKVVSAFVELCIVAADDAAGIAAATAQGGTPVTDMPPGPAGAPPVTHYRLSIDGVTTRVGFGDWLCAVDVEAVDVPAAVAEFDGFLAAVLADWHRYDSLGETPSPPNGSYVRDLHLAAPGDEFGMHLQLIATESPGETPGMFLFRRFEAPDPRALAAAAAAPVSAPATPAPAPALPVPPQPVGVDVPPMEDVAGRANFPPHYPDAAAKACVSGTTLLRVNIDAEGNVLDVGVEKSSRSRELDAAAMEAARQWRFQPGSRNGQPVGGIVIVPVRFNDPCPDPSA